MTRRIRQVVTFSLIAFAANFEYGFSSTYLNTPIDEFKNYLNESLKRMGHTMTYNSYNWMWNLILNIWFVGFFIGIWFSPLLNDKFGRKVGFLVGNGFSLLGAIFRLLSICLYRPELLFVGRVITSVCGAITYQSCILYLQECSPTHLRGLISFLSEISFALMCLIGTLLGTQQLLGNDLIAYMGFAVPFCAFFFVVLFFIPETPKYLLISRLNREDAEKSVRFYHGKEVDVDAVLKEITLEAEREKGSPSFRVILEIFTKKHLRKALFLSCSALQNTVALWSLLLSSTYFLKNSNLNSEVAAWSSTGMTLAYVLGTLSGSMMIERLGRRTLLLSFTVTNNVILILYVLFSELQPLLDFLKYFCLIALFAYGFTYGCGVGPISWFISSELVPQKYRSLTQSLCYAINTIMVVITTFTILPLYNSIGSYAFLVLYSLPSSFSLLYLFFELPETKGKEIHEIVLELKRKTMR